MKLVLLVGGKGTRLYPLTYNLPKVMLPINKKPILEYLIEWGKNQGIEEIIICSGHLHKAIEKHFGDGSKFNIKINYSIEKEPLGTGGPLKLAEKLIGKRDFFLLNGDILCNINLKKALEFHESKNSLVTIITQKSTHPMESDLIETDENNKVIKIWTKPHKETPPTKISNAGAYIVNSKIIENIPHKNISFEKEIIPQLQETNEKIYAYYTEEFLEDMGDHKRLEELKDRIKANNNMLPKFLHKDL